MLIERQISYETLLPLSAGITYDLVGVVVHHGLVGFGHYTAYVRSSCHSWYHYDDASAPGPCSTDEVLSARAYLLFYEHRDNSEMQTDTKAMADPDVDDVPPVENQTSQNGGNDLATDTSETNSDEDAADELITKQTHKRATTDSSSPPSSPAPSVLSTTLSPNDTQNIEQSTQPTETVQDQETKDNKNERPEIKQQPEDETGIKIEPEESTRVSEQKDTVALPDDSKLKAEDRITTCLEMKAEPVEATNAPVVPAENNPNRTNMEGPNEKSTSKRQEAPSQHEK